MMHKILLRTCVAVLIAALLSVSGQAYAHTVAPVNGNANQKTKNTMNYLAHLPNKNNNSILSGLFGGYSNDTFTLNEFNQLHTSTGQYPAIMACDYARGWATAQDPTTLINYSCNSGLKSHANQGGLVTVSLHLPNPVNANGGGVKEKGSLVFADLLKPATATGKRWIQYKNKIAEGLADLQSAGVTVLFRPFHEVNGSWFWWGGQDPATFKNVWMDLYNDFTNTKGLDNLLWVYAASQSRDNKLLYYPGAAYVDIVGMDAYLDDPVTAEGYTELLSLRKPFAFAEIGPGTVNNSFDYTKWINAINERYPEAIYFLTWDKGWSPVNNLNASAFMNNASVVNRGEVTLTSITESVNKFDFESGTLGWTGTNLTGSPSTDTTFKVNGNNSLKGNITLTGGSQYSLRYNSAVQNFSSKSFLKARVKHASWGTLGAGGMTAKLYVKSGSSLTWKDGGTIAIDSAGPTTLTLPLSNVSNVNDIREVGIMFSSPAGSSGSSAVYVDYVTLQ
ncbi:beta-mannosidase [Paenibacillus sp. F411]|uniref:glycosyl hydrolase n=1 Tax=Paenibacillus sp. F411 TaxID=2820239 RepID=UPI001AAEE9BE|nr:glycosyl hydrolase [Paenibacillus sp. F411]MBO2944375.1 beta-mannosidase [Paenibacillus sp. F411]